MRSFTSITALILALTFGAGTPLSRAEEPKGEPKPTLSVDGTVGMAYADSFLARPGFRPADTVSLQASASLTVTHLQGGALSVSYWGNISGSPLDEQEHDAIVSYTTPALDLGILGDGTATVTWAHIETYGATLQEIGGTIALANPLNPSLTIAHDYRDGSGTYGWLALSPGFDLVEDQAGIGVSVAGVVNSHYFTESTRFSGVRLDGSLWWTPLESTRFSVDVRHFAPVDDDNFERATSVGVGFEYSFEIYSTGTPEPESIEPQG